MKKILTIVLLVTSVNADMCQYHIQEATRAMEKSNVRETLKEVYIKMAIGHLIDAKYDCPKAHKKAIEASIKHTKELL